MVDVGHTLGGESRWVASRWLAALRWRGSDSADGAELSSRQVGALFVALLVVASIPVMLHPWPPLTDYMNHLSRMHVIADAGSDPDLARFYEVNWQILPNLMMDLIVPALARLTNIFIAGQIYTIASFMLILSGALTLNRQLFGRWSVLPLLAAPLLYNYMFLIGTMNYVSAIGLALWALAAWVWLRERALMLRLGVSALFVLALFFCHLYSVGIYGVGLLAYELQRLWQFYGPGRPAQTRLSHLWRGFDFVATGLPFMPVLPLLMASPTWGLRAEWSWELDGKLEGLQYVVQTYFPFAAVLALGVVAILAGAAMVARVLKVHPLGWSLLAVGGVVYFAMPRMIFDTHMADQRLPISIVFMLIACGHLSIRNAFVRRGFATVLVVLLALRIFEVQSVWNETSQIANSFRDSVQQIDRGSKVLVAYADPYAGDDTRELGLVHAACLAIIERSSLVTTAFTVVGKQILRARDAYRDRVDTEDATPPSVEQLLNIANNPDIETDAYWGDWTADFDYLYVLFTGATHENPDPTRLMAAYVGERFALYKILPPRPEPAVPAPPASQAANAGLAPLPVAAISTP